jgi:hypothetical protein
MLREVLAVIVRKGEAGEPVSKNENDLLKQFLRDAIGQTQKDGSYSTNTADAPICESIRTHFPGTWTLIWMEKRKQQKQ